MCGRYTQTKGVKVLKERFRIVASEAEELEPRYNVAPSQQAAVVVAEDSGRALRLFRWGLIPSWAKDAAIGYKMINARAETILEKPSYRHPFAKTRCLVLADGFYEWVKNDAGTKRPMRIKLRSGEPFAMAGLWEKWRDPAGKEIKSFTVITTTAAPSLRKIHERMPVILDREGEDAWLDGAAQPTALLPLLRPHPDELIETHPVSGLVNSPKNDVPGCIAPLAAS